MSVKKDNISEVKSYKWTTLKNNPPKNAVLYVLDPLTKTIELFITDKNGVPRTVKAEAASINISDYVVVNPDNSIEVHSNQLFVKKYVSGDEYINIVPSGNVYEVTLNVDKIELNENKQNDLTEDGTGVKYPTVDAVNQALSEIELTPGKSAYQIAVDNGFIGTEEEWLESLVGADGNTPYINSNGNWEIDGVDTGVRAQGEDGLSAYEVWIQEGNTGSEEDFLNSLIGEDGKSAYQIWLDEGNTGSIQDFFDSLQGNDGKSAYQEWLDLGNTGTPQDFIDSLKGEDGTDGIDGSVVTIGGNNNWFIDGVDTGVRAVGEDGQDGYTPIKGIDYFDGEDGYTPIKNIDYFDGQDGTDGNTWFGGTSNPAGATGTTGDWYINTTTWDVFEKTGSTTWTLRGNIKGEKGDQGIQGISAIISAATASVSNTTGIPNVVVTLGGTPQNRTFHFDFTNLKGEDGADGKDGSGVRIVGTLPDTSQLPIPPATPEDAYIIDGDLWVWDDLNGNWVNAGPIQGPPGVTGPPNVLNIGTVTTGAPGSPASATITGTSPSQILNLVIPEGLPGSNAPTYTASNGIQIVSNDIRPVYGSIVGTIAQGNDPRFHDAVTLGTSNGLSLSGQVLSLGTASSTTTGALTAADWILFNSKTSANDGDISYTGTGAITGGGLSTANQSGNTSYTFDLLQSVKDDIADGVTAFSWGDHSLMGYLTAADLPIVNDGILTLSTGAGLTGAGSFTANQAGNSTFNVALAPATATTIGGLELFSNITQTVASNPVTSTAGRTYGIQFNSDGQAVVNVPWLNTNTTYTAGTGINISGSNVISNTSPNITQVLGLTGNTLTLSNGGGSVVLPTSTDTVTRLRGTTSGTFVSGDITLLAGTNTTISQSGNNITIASTDTTYSAGNGLTLTGTVFSLPVNISGTGNYVSDVIQTANGITVTKSTLPTFTDAITSISRDGLNIPIVSQNVDIPIFDTSGAGLVPERVGSTTTRFLREDGTWVIPTNTTYTAGSGISIVGGVITNTSPNVAQVLGLTGNTLSLTNGGGSVTLPTVSVATETTYGTVKLFSDTVQPTASNPVTSTAGRTYGIQFNSDGQMVVNIPWNNTNTTYSGSTSIILSGTSFQRAALTGDVTSPQNSNTTTITNNSVTFPKMQNIGTNVFLGRNSTGTGNIETLTPAQALSMLGVQPGANNYTHPNHTGDVTSIGDGTTTIANNVVSFAKMQNINTQRLLGRGASGVGSVQEITLGANLTLSTAGVLTATNTNTTYSGANGIQLVGTVFSPVYGTTANTVAQGNDSRFHNPVTLGTANGLSLSGQALSLGLSGASSTGALSSAHWNIFNSKFDLPAGGTVNHYLNGTGSWSLFPNIPAQVNLTQGTGILITGTYPNLTITNSAPNVNQTLSVGAAAGSVSISMGNSVVNSSLSLQGRQDADVRRNEHSFVPYLASAGSTNYPTTNISTGFRIERYSSPTSQIGMDFNTTGADDNIWYKTFNGTNNEYGWYRIASREWANDTFALVSQLSNYFRFVRTLTSGDDLDTILDIGIYVQNSNANATSANNYPATYAGILKVYRASSNHIIQEYTPFSPVSGQTTYQRYYYSGTWYPWKQNAYIGDNLSGFNNDVGYITSSSLPTNYITTNTNQTGLTGNKTTSGVWTFNNQINTVNHGDSSQWKQAYDWGDFRDYGLGTVVSNRVVLNITHNMPAGLYASSTASTGVPLSGSSGSYIALQTGVSSGSNSYLWLLGNNTAEPRAFISHTNNTGVQTPWREIITEQNINSFISGNYLPLAGGTMTNNSAINWAALGQLQVGGLNRLRFTNANTVMASETGGSIYFRPLGDTNASNQIIFDGNGQINTANHGNSSQWNHEPFGLGTQTGVSITSTTNRFRGFYDIGTSEADLPTGLVSTVANITVLRGNHLILTENTTNNPKMYFGVSGSSSSMPPTWQQILTDSNISSYNYATETWVTQQINNISIPTVNDGTLSLATGTGLTGSATFTANQAGSSTFSVAVASTHKLPTITEWNALSTQTLSSSTSNLIVSNTVQRAALTGDVTALQNSNATTIANSAVTHAKYQNIPTARILGRVTAGTGNVEELTQSQVLTFLGVQSGANNYTHPNHTGDVTSVGDGATTIVNNAITTAKIANAQVTHAKYQNIAQNTFLGRIASGSGSPTALTVAEMQSALGIPTNIGVTNVSATVAGNALNVNVTNPSTTPALGFTWAGNSNQVVLGNGSLAALPTDTVTQIGVNGGNYSTGSINFIPGNLIGITKSGNNVTVSYTGVVPSQGRTTELYQYHGQSTNVPSGFRISVVHIDGNETITLDPGEYDGDEVCIMPCNTISEYVVIGLDNSIDACQNEGSHTLGGSSRWIWYENNSMWLRAG